MQIEVVAFKELKNLCPKDPNFGEAQKACVEPITLDKIKRLDFTIQDGMVFKGIQFPIPRSSMRQNLIEEKYNEGLVGHFRRVKNISLVVENYYWPQSQQDVNKFVQSCRVHQMEKGMKHNTRLYQPLPVLKNLRQDVNMDFIPGLQRTQKGHDSILQWLTGFQRWYILTPTRRLVMLFMWESYFLEKW